MARVRLISRLDVKGPNLVKGIHLEGLRPIGDPQQYAQRYYREGIDELIYIDAVASLYGRDSLLDVVRHTVKHVFVPITVGGGIRSVADATEALRAGADKVAINTGAVRNPQLISDIARRFGSQCMVLSIDVRRRTTGGWEVFVENGRERTGMDALKWVKEAVTLGAGELLLTSIDQEGTRRGFDQELIFAVAGSVSIPMIVSGGMGTLQDAVNAAKAGADGIAMADVLHRNRLALGDIRDHALRAGLDVRPFACCAHRVHGERES